MKILYVHYRPANTETQIKAVQDKVKMIKEVSKNESFMMIGVLSTLDHDGAVTLRNA